MVVQRGGHRGEFLQRFHPPEPQHRPLSSSEWKMRVLDPVVHPATHLAAITVAEFAHRGGVLSESVSNDRLGPTVTLQSLLQKGQSRCFIALFGNVAFQDLAC